MPRILRFRGVRYDPGRAPDLTRVTAPPYDMISPAEQEELYRRDPHNVVRLIRTLFVRANVCTLDPQIIQFNVPDAVAFQVIDSLDGDSARGDFAGTFPGVVRPLAKWTTEFSTNGCKSSRG